MTLSKNISSETDHSVFPLSGVAGQDRDTATGDEEEAEAEKENLSSLSS